MPDFVVHESTAEEGVKGDAENESGASESQLRSRRCGLQPR